MVVAMLRGRALTALLLAMMALMLNVMAMKAHPVDGDVGEMAKVGAHDSSLE